jgi:LPXTG-site transpeptidase (sortase) family protein
VVTRNKYKKFTLGLAVLVFVCGTGATLALLILTKGPNSQGSADKSPLLKSTAPTSEVPASSRNYGLPVRLTIPKINVDAAVAYMGLTSSGHMEAPKTNEDTGWYKYGPHPGNAGSAVIAGHLGVGSSAVFTQLGLLVKGDTMSVTDDRGQVVSFVVTGTHAYDNDSEPTEVFSSSTGAHLNLITCNGVWEPGDKTYTKRLVVFADRA